MNDLKKFVHGEEGIGATHYACQEEIEKGNPVCCACHGHKCKPEPKTHVNKNKKNKHENNVMLTQPKPQSKTKLRFEANMLDGDKVEDCGGAMLSAKAVYEYLESEQSALLQRVIELIGEPENDPGEQITGSRRIHYQNELRKQLIKKISQMGEELK